MRLLLVFLVLVAMVSCVTMEEAPSVSDTVKGDTEERKALVRKKKLEKAGFSCFLGKEAAGCQALSNYYKKTGEEEKRVGTLVFFNCDVSYTKDGCGDSSALYKLLLKERYNGKTKGFINKLCKELEHHSCRYGTIKALFSDVKKQEMLDSMKSDIADCSGKRADKCYSAAIKLEKADELNLAKNILEQACIEGHRKSCTKREFVRQEIERGDRLRAEQDRIAMEKERTLMYQEAESARARREAARALHNAIFPPTRNINLNINGRTYSDHNIRFSP